MTFKSWGLAPTNTLGLFVVLYLINAIFLAVYVISQIFLVVGTLQDRWPLGHIGFGVLFFVIGQVILYVFGSTICNAAQHYLDGLFFATVCNLLAVMMVYKVCPHRDFPTVAPTDTSSTGIRLQKKISSSVLAPNKVIGKSRSHCRRTTDVVRYTTTALRNMRAACITRLPQGPHIMAATINNLASGLHTLLLHHVFSAASKVLGVLAASTCMTWTSGSHNTDDQGIMALMMSIGYAVGFCNESDMPNINLM